MRLQVATFPNVSFPVSPSCILYDHILEKVLWIHVGEGVSFCRSQPGGYLHILSNKFSIFNSNRTNLDIKYEEHWFVFYLLNAHTLAIFGGEEGRERNMTESEMAKRFGLFNWSYAAYSPSSKNREVLGQPPWALTV